MTPSEWYMSPRAASLSDACRSLAPMSRAAVLYCSLQYQQSHVLLVFVRHSVNPPASLIHCWMLSCMPEFVASESVITSWIQHTAALQLGNCACPSLLLPFHNPCIVTTCSTTYHPICCCSCDTCLHAATYCLSAASRSRLCRIRFCCNCIWFGAVPLGSPI